MPAEFVARRLSLGFWVGYTDRDMVEKWAGVSLIRFWYDSSGILRDSQVLRYKLVLRNI